MAFLTINGIPVDVAIDSAAEDTPLMAGTSTRAFDNSLLSSKRNPKRNLSYKLPFMTQAELTTLRASAPEGSWATVNGDAIANVAGTFEISYSSISYDMDSLSFKRTPVIKLAEV